MSLFNLSGAVGLLATHTVSVQRFATDTYDANGYAAARTSLIFTARASVQPISGKDLARLPDGTNASGFVSIWSNKNLALRDRVTVPGKGTFEVEHLDEWDTAGAYTKVIAKQLDESEPRA